MWIIIFMCSEREGSDGVDKKKKRAKSQKIPDEFAY